MVLRRSLRVLEAGSGGLSLTERNRAVEAALAKFFGRREAVATSRGTAALYLALSANLRKGDEVLIPAIVCPDVLYAAIYAGVTPVLCDVRLEDFTLDPRSARSRVTGKTRAMVAVHTFGNPCQMEELTKVAESNDLGIIEDLAQAPGSTYRGRGLESPRDIATILSFGGGKIIDLGGGGAVLTDSARMARELRKRESALAGAATDPQIGHETYRKLYYSAVELSRFDPEGGAAVLMLLPKIFKSSYLNRATAISPRRLRESLESLGDEKRERRRKALEYRRRLRGPSFVHPTLQEGANVFRYSFMVRSRGLRDGIVSALRKDDIHASTLYPSLEGFYATHELPNAGKVADRIINLWVDSAADDDYIERSCDMILEVVEDTGTGA